VRYGAELNLIIFMQKLLQRKDIPYFFFLCVFVVKKYCLVRYGAELKLIV